MLQACTFLQQAIKDQTTAWIPLVLRFSLTQGLVVALSHPSHTAATAAAETIGRFASRLDYVTSWKGLGSDGVPGLGTEDTFRYVIKQRTPQLLTELVRCIGVRGSRNAPLRYHAALALCSLVETHHDAEAVAQVRGRWGSH